MFQAAFQALHLERKVNANCFSVFRLSHDLNSGASARRSGTEAGTYDWNQC
jgi:hypothetical protein